MKKLILTFSLFLSLLSLSQAQQVYKGLGTSFSTFLFGYTSYAAKSQCIFLPSDFNNLMDGDITRIYYRYGTAGTDQTLTRFSISMGQTNQTSFTGNNFFNSLTQVFYRESYTINGGLNGDWFYIDLDTPYTYDSTKTLIVQLIFPESAIDSWGTLGTSNTPPKKMISPDTLATTGDPSSSTWQDFGFDIATSSGIKTFTNSRQLDFTIAPVPANKHLSIQVMNAVSNQFQLTIKNSIGQSILEQQINNSTENIDLTKYPNGLYFVSLKDENGIIKSKKLVIEK